MSFGNSYMNTLREQSPRRTVSKARCVNACLCVHEVGVKRHKKEEQ